MRKEIIVIVGLILGFLLVIQSESYAGVNEILQRDKESNVFQEISILKQKNEDLNREVSQLGDNLVNLADQDSALLSIEEEIRRYKILSGKFPIVGPGIKMTIREDIASQWMIDLINEFFVAGAEAVDVNGVRIANHTIGLDVLPQGQLLLNGVILETPYELRVIGEATEIRGVLEAPGALVDRILASYPQLELEIEEMDLIDML